MPTKAVYQYFLETTSSLTISGLYDIKANTSFLRDTDYQLLWVHNGTRLNLDSSRYNASLEFESETHLRLTLDIFNLTDSDAGFYIGVVTSEQQTLFNYFGCDVEDVDWFYYRSRTVYIPVGFVLVAVKRLGKIKLTTD